MLIGKKFDYYHSPKKIVECNKKKVVEKMIYYRKEKGVRVSCAKIKTTALSTCQNIKFSKAIRF